MQTRRQFIKTTAAAGAGAAFSGSGMISNALNQLSPRRIHISRVSSDFEREPLIRPFGFKGGYMTEIWQSAAYMESDSGNHSIGLCSQSVLWSDAAVFAAHSESGGNALMYSMTERALQLAEGQTFSMPTELLDALYPEVYAYGRKITSRDDLRKTFALNALVAVDNAAWLLYARENGFSSFDEMIPAAFRPALSAHHNRVAAIPLMAYTIPLPEIKAAAEQGYFFMKIKIGQPGTQDEMLGKDMERLSAIHSTIGKMDTPYTQNGKLPYYFDANGRYEKKETLLRLIDHAKKIGAFGQIAIIEEPFPEEYETDVSDVPVRLAADESAHTAEDAVKRMEMGYNAVALKAIAKTLSMTMKIAMAAHERAVPCFCADLTVNPVLVDWNKNVAARLASFPGLDGLGLLESNGHQNYRNWKTMMNYHPRKDAGWINVNKGLYELDEDFYRSGGGIFDQVDHYEKMFHKS